MSTSSIGSPHRQIFPTPFSILQDLSVKDVARVRCVQTEVHKLLYPNTQPPSPSAKQLPALEIGIVKNIAKALFPVNLNPLFTALCERFASAYNSNDEMVEKAALQFVSLVNEDVYDPSPQGQQEYMRVKHLVDQMAAQGEFSYGVEEEETAKDNAIFPSHEVEDDGEEGVSSITSQQDVIHHAQGFDPWNDESYADASTMFDSSGMTEADLTFCNKLQSYNEVHQGDWAEERVAIQDATSITGRQPSNTFAFNEQVSLQDSQTSQSSPDFGDDEAVTLTDRENFIQATRIKNQKHKSVRGRGEKFVITDDHDRAPAVANGIPQLSKLRAVFQTEKEDPQNPDHKIPGKPAEYVYHHAVIWNDKQSVQKLNNWRSQMFRRALGPGRETRTKWTMQEHDYLLQILREHIESAAVAGRYSRIDWEYVAAKFNRKWEGHTFKAGELLATVGRNKKSIANRELGKLQKDTKCLPRTYMSMQNQLAHFTSQRAKAILKKAKDADEQDRLRGFVATSQDESEDKRSTTETEATTSVDENIDPRLRSSLPETITNDNGKSQNTAQQSNPSQTSEISQKVATGAKIVTKQSNTTNRKSKPIEPKQSTQQTASSRKRKADVTDEDVQSKKVRKNETQKVIPKPNAITLKQAPAVFSPTRMHFNANDVPQHRDDDNRSNVLHFQPNTSFQGQHPATSMKRKLDTLETDEDEPRQVNKVRKIHPFPASRAAGMAPQTFSPNMIQASNVQAAYTPVGAYTSPTNVRVIQMPAAHPYAANAQAEYCQAAQTQTAHMRTGQAQVANAYAPHVHAANVQPPHVQPPHVQPHIQAMNIPSTPPQSSSRLNQIFDNVRHSRPQTPFPAQYNSNGMGIPGTPHSAPAAAMFTPQTIAHPQGPADMGWEENAQVFGSAKSDSFMKVANHRVNPGAVYPQHAFVKMCRDYQMAQAAEWAHQTMLNTTPSPSVEMNQTYRTNSEVLNPFEDARTRSF